MERSVASEPMRVSAASAALALFLGACARHPADMKAKAAAPVATAVIAQGDVADERTGLGRVQAFNVATVRAQAQGEILKVLFTEGQSVRTGQPIAQIDPRPLQATLDQDTANAAKDQASLANAAQLVERNTPLAPQGVVSAAQLDAERTQVAVLKSTVDSDQAIVRRDRLQLDYATVRAPADGVTGLRLKGIGDLVGPTDPAGLVTIAQIQPITVVFTLPQSDLPQIRAHMASAGSAELEVDAYAQGSGARLDVGRLLMIDNVVDQTNGTITLKAVFPNASRQLWPGEFVNAHLVLDHRANALTAPSSAVQRNDKGAYAWVVSATGVASPRPITVGPTLGERTIIENGLSPGDRVVTDGQFNLTPGARVAAGARPKGAATPQIALDSLGGIQ